MLEAVAQMCSVKKVFLEISQNSQENTCARAPPVAAPKCLSSQLKKFKYIERVVGKYQDCP